MVGESGSTRSSSTTPSSTEPRSTKPTPPTKQVAIAIVRDGDFFLVGTRTKQQTLGGYSEFPGGQLEPDESPVAAACRECLEETQIAVSIVRSLAVVEHVYAHGALEIHFFLCELATAADRPIPAPPFQWVSRKDLATLKFPPANEGVLRQLLSSNQK